MHLAMHFPGIAAPPDEFMARWGRVTPEQMSALEKAAGTLLKGERDMKLAHTKGIMSAAAGRRL